MSYSAEEDEVLSFNWARATADMAALHCPKCGVENLKGASPHITCEQNGRYVCSLCGHDWAVSHHSASR